ncbi:MAG: DNA-directed RNA polymerase subunit omega [Thermodesulfobacteriota bacterium]
MARITIEDGLKRGYSKFLLVHLAAKRVMELRKGKDPLVECNNREIVRSLREIEEGKVSMRPGGEAYLDVEPELPPPTGDHPGDHQIEPENMVQTSEEPAEKKTVSMEGQEAGEGTGDQAESEVDQGDEETSESEADESVMESESNKQESSSNDE